MRVATLVCCAWVASSALHAQSHPQTRSGFNISFGFGSGSAGVSCDGCESDRRNSVAGYLRIGGTLKPNLVLAGESSAWTKEEDDARVTISTLNLVAQFYPSVTNGFFLLGGLGAGRVGASVTSGSTTVTSSGNGMGYELGTGYDWRLGTNFSVSPFLTYFGTSGVKIEGDKLNGNVFVIGLGLTWH